MVNPPSGTGSQADAITLLMREHFDDIWRYARRRCQSPEDADDVAAEVFATACRRGLADGLPSPDERRVWLFGVARRVLANQRRSAVRRDRLHLRLAQEPRPPSPETEVTDDSLWRALGELSDDDRDLILMRAWDQISVTDIAVILDCTPNAVSVRLHKARGRLAEQLDQTDLRDGGHETAIPTTKEDRNE